MLDFVDIFAEELRIATFQPREARMRYQLPRCDERVQAPEGKRRLHTQAPAPSTCDELVEVECAVVRKTLAIGTAILSMILVCSTAAEEQHTALPRYVGAIMGDPEKDSFGYPAADLPLRPQAAIFLSDEPRYVGQQTGDKEKDTFARVEVRRQWTSGIEE